MAGNKFFNTQDLILNVNTKSYDPVKIPLHDWEPFLQALCGTREYQKEAIKTSIVYLASTRYTSIESLIKENYQVNDQLKLRYPTEQEYISKIQIKNKLSGNIDLATGTGKSYVMYGIAQIALGIGLVNRVLVLGPPSLTIEKELTKKFNELSASSFIKGAIPQSSITKNPTIINAENTIKENTICIENINAVYAKTGSSIFDSLSFGRGSDCLVLNDEVHHVYNTLDGKNEESKNSKRWKEFLTNTSYDFKYILGFTGTAYINNDYFNDVIYRYSLKKGIENKFIKTVNYIVEDENQNENEKFQKILHNHKLNKLTYPLVKPLTILITKDIKEAKMLYTRLGDFLAEKKELTEQSINNKILLVTSDKAHKSNVLKLSHVDNIDESVEWIISVAMLTEGWDVKNVFQIVPMEEKAFNSKLLIAQVLGRGLRIPPSYPNAEVTVFNHDKWSSRIKNLVEEILEIETKLTNSPLLSSSRSKHHFKLYNLNYKKDYTEIETKETKVFNYKDYIEFVTESFEHVTEVKYFKINDREYPIEYKIEKEKFLITDVVDKVYDEFQIRKLEGITLKLNNTDYTNDNLPTKKVIEDLIRNSMSNIGMEGDYIGKINRQSVFSSFNTLLRKKPRSVSLSKTPDAISTVDTAKREHETISVLSLRSDSTVFYTVDYETEIIKEDTIRYLKEVIEDETMLQKSFVKDINPYLFKTPIDIVFTTAEPERKFVKELIKTENASKITSWIKSKNQNFYSIEYTISTKAGKHSSQHLFNPDFFIYLKKSEYEYIAVVETKSDNDISVENKQKYKYGIEHFSDLNKLIEQNHIKQKYFFYFLSPSSYIEFFECLRDGRLFEGKFRSQLEQLMLSQE
jgi:type III restriction enzyme